MVTVDFDRGLHFFAAEILSKSSFSYTYVSGYIYSLLYILDVLQTGFFIFP